MGPCSIAVAAVLVLVSGAQAKASDLGQAKKTLQNLKGELPKIVSDLVKAEKSFGKPIFDCSPADVHVKVVRQISVSEAKITFEIVDESNRKSIITMFLVYYEGKWTTVRHEATLKGSLGGFQDLLPILALTVDEFFENPKGP
jgi:hypothetical protein